MKRLDAESKLYLTDSEEQIKLIDQLQLKENRSHLVTNKCTINQVLNPLKIFHLYKATPLDQRVFRDLNLKH